MIMVAWQTMDPQRHFLSVVLLVDKPVLGDSTNALHGLLLNDLYLLMPFPCDG
jgi:hypothetical protein